MPHQRPRTLLSLFLKRLKLSPVVALMGARQTGKSTFLREIVSKHVPLQYFTLDRRELRQAAERSPGQWIQLESREERILCIDEVQKVPDLFDEIKAEVDANRRPGRFILSGSTEFSKKTGIRESLTGRVMSLQMFPMTLSELYPQHYPDLTVNQLMTGVRQGGLPGICFVRDADAREALFQSWLETLVYKDLLEFRIPKFKPDFAISLLEAIARLGFPMLSDLSSELETDPRRIKHYIEAFAAVFVIYRVSPIRGSTGKERFCLFDSGVAGHLGADWVTCLMIRWVNDLLSLNAWSGGKPLGLTYFQPRGGDRVDLVFQGVEGPVAIQFRDSQEVHPYALRGPLAFCKRKPKSKVFLMVPGIERVSILPGIELVPWSKMGCVLREQIQPKLSSRSKS